MKRKCVMSVAAMLTAYALTTSVTYSALQQSYTTTDTVAGETDAYTNSGVGVSNGATLTITGTENLSVTMENGADESLGMNITGANLTAENLNITVTPGNKAVNNRPKGMIVRGTSDTKIDNLNVTVTKSNRQADTGHSPDSDAAYGVAVGYGWNGGDKDATTKFTVNNANIVVNNTEDTKRGNYTGIPIRGGKFETGYQMSGIRLYRSNGAKPEFHSTGTVNVTVEDKSAPKVADYLVGVYVSGTDAKAMFDGDTSITVKANGINSAGIKIGKPGNGDAGVGAQVVANGKLTVDTTGTNGVVTWDRKEYRGSGAVRLFDNGSKFTVTGANTKEASEIKSSTNAIVFDTFDYKNLGAVNTGFLGTFKEVLARGKENVNNVVTLHNTKLSTTSEVDDLVLTNAEFKKEGSLILGARWLGKEGVLRSHFDWGAKSVKNAQFTLSGELSEATAAKKGWLIHAKSENKDAAEAQRATSELTATIKDKALVTGLIQADKWSTLNMTVATGATWRLAKKEDLTGPQTATATTVTLSNGGILDAGTNLTDGSKAEYTVTTVQKDGTTASAFNNTGGIITTVNKSYEDVLTLNGNYIGTDGTVKMNTKWDSPGDDVGTNSKSDLLHITGTATGTTKIVPVSANGKEEVIDGSIGSIAADLNKNSVPVVRADTEAGTEEGAFTGVAKTTGAGELKLVHRVKDNKHEWYWTLTGLNKTPMLDKRVPGYTQMPEVNTRMIGQILRTLHERRSENPRVLHEQRHMESYPTSRVMYAHHEEGDQHPFWAKVIKDYGHHNGYRFGYTLHTNGIQLGRDWNVKTKEDGTTSFNSGYVAYQYGQAKFYDNFNTDDKGQQATDLQTGTGTVRNLSIGVTRTKYGAHDQYVDWVGQLSFLRNAYEAVGHSKETQSSWGFAGSVETGRPHVLRENEHGRTILEPQGQLVYSYLKLQGIHGTDKAVSHGGHGTLVGRIGVRLSRESYNRQGVAHRTVYGVVNIWQTFTNAYAVHIGQDTLRGDYGRTIGELGIGAQWRTSDRWYVYGDVRFERNLGGSYYQGYRGNVSVKYIW